MEFIKGLRAGGVEADIVVSTACVDDTVLGLPESEGMNVELQGYNVCRPASLTDFANWELGVRDKAIDDYGPEAAESDFMHDSFCTMIWMWQIANERRRRRRPLRRRDAVRRARQRSAATTSSAATRSTAPGRRRSTSRSASAPRPSWCGTATKFIADPDLRDKYIDVTELMNAVAKSNPRKTG